MDLPDDTIELVELLLREGLISHKQQEDVRLERLLTGRPFRSILIEMGLLPDTDQVTRLSRRYIYEWKAQRLRIPFVDLSIYKPDNRALEAVPGFMARQYNILPIKKDGNTLYVAMSDLNDLKANDDIRLASRCMVRGVLAVPEHITEAIQTYYGTG